MSYYEQDSVEIYERKFALDFLYRMYQEGRLSFPQTENTSTNPVIVSNLIRAIQIGIPMPVIYASELQNGDFLILESKNRLIALLEYLQGLFPAYIEGILSNPKSCLFYKLNQEDPRLAAMILRTVFQFQIIDYRTPKYLHMETGLFYEAWSSTQEQSIRNILYAGQNLEALHAFCNEIIKRTSRFFNPGNPMTENEILYMVLFWAVYQNRFPSNTPIGLGGQQLLDMIIQSPYDRYNEWPYFSEIVENFTACCVAQPFITNPGSYWNGPYFSDHLKIKTIGVALCLYDISLHKGKDPYSSLNYFFTSNMYIPQIDALPLTLNNIRFYLASLWEDARL